MFILKPRREREKIIVQMMINMNCKANHRFEGKLCDECVELSAYAEKRLLSCLYGEVKPVCKECPVHCYSPQRREQMKQVMQFSGPRMIYQKPFYAFAHLIDNIMAPKPKRKATSKIRKNEKDFVI
jgi:hypothetical protein